MFDPRASLQLELRERHNRLNNELDARHAAAQALYDELKDCPAARAAGHRGCDVPWLACEDHWHQAQALEDHNTALAVMAGRLHRLVREMQRAGCACRSCGGLRGVINGSGLCLRCAGRCCPAGHVRTVPEVWGDYCDTCNAEDERALHGC